MPPRKRKQKMSKRTDSRLNKRIRKERGNICVVCSTVKRIKGHHIIPRRDNGPNSRNNIVLLCHNHHKIADRIQDNQFLRFEIMNQPRTQEELVNFIKLIEKSQTGTRKSLNRFAIDGQTVTPGFPSPRKFYMWYRQHLTNTYRSC